MNKVNEIKNTISKANAQLVSIDFIKKDGSTRTMLFNPKTAKGLVGDKASDQAKQAVATRKANNPNLISVCDQSLLAKGELASKCWRSINLETVVKVKSGGVEVEYI